MVVIIAGHVMTRLFVVVVFLLGGCASLRTTEEPETLPQIIYQVPLPAWPSSSTDREIILDLKIRVGSDGSVRDAAFVTPTGFREWDAQALQVVRKWRFSPAMVDGKPVPLWIHQTVRMRFEPPTFMALAELACIEANLADSIHTLLGSGESFDSLAKRFSVAGSRERGGLLGEVDVRTFPAHIRHELVKLQEGQFTKPLLLGRQHVMYKRLARAIEAKAN